MNFRVFQPLHRREWCAQNLSLWKGVLGGHSGIITRQPQCGQASFLGLSLSIRKSPSPTPGCSGKEANEEESSHLSLTRVLIPLESPAARRLGSLILPKL